MSLRNLLVAATLLSFSALGDDPTTVTLKSQVKMPEVLLPAGSYKFQVEDRLADRAIVRVTEPNGTFHFVLTIPNSSLPHNNGLLYFSGTDAIRAWKSLEFVYPKEEAIKLTAEAGKPVLAFDSTYDKLPDTLSADDRKVVTLWLLTPKRVTADGHGLGLTAVKYSKPMSQEAPPTHMPKTASNVYLELAIGGLLLSTSGLVQLWRKGNVIHV